MPDDTRHIELEQQLAAREREIAQLQRGRAIERELACAEAIDPETAGLLIERRIESDEALRESEAIDYASLVAALRREKPFLFRESDSDRSPAPNRGSRGVATSPRIEPLPSERLRDVADEARATGRLADLLRYLRARRKVHQRE